MGSSSMISAVAKRLQGKVALITGGAGGIGTATAKLFAEHGARLIIADVDDNKGHALCTSLGPTTATYVHCDVTNESDVSTAVDTAISLHGKLDIMFCNAGIVDKSDIHLPIASKSVFETVMRTNVTNESDVSTATSQMNGSVDIHLPICDVHCDVTNESDVSTAVDTAISLHGKLDIMFCNAGIVDKSDIHLPIASKSVFETVMRTNVTGTFLATKHAARVMISAGNGGSIIMTASSASAIGGLVPSYSYACSKHAIVGLMRTATAELGAHGVRVNCVSPHVTPTAMATYALEMDEEMVENFTEINGNLKGVKLKAGDIAETVLYLGSDESRYVSGVNLLVDGGFTVVKKFM